MRCLWALTLEELKIGLFNTFNGDLVIATKNNQSLLENIILKRNANKPKKLLPS